MAGTAFTTLGDYVDDYVSGASDEAALLLRASVFVFQDFSRKTHCWKETIDEIDVVADQKAYTLTPGTNHCTAAEIIGLNKAEYKEDDADDIRFATLDLKAKEWMDVYDKGWENRDSGTVPYRCFWNELDGKLYLIDTPGDDSDEGLKVEVMLMPGLAATTAPTFIFKKYSRILTRGIAGYLMQMTNQRWSNTELGDRYWRKYMDGRNLAQQEVDRGAARLEDFHVIPEQAFTGGAKNRSRGTSTGFGGNLSA
jgi:hypothetical protein